MRTTFDERAFPVEPFTLHVPDSVLADLKERLARTRLPDNEPKAAPWRYGTSLAYMRDVVAHWRDRYDWRAWEARINAFSHHKTTIGGKKIHFILERGSGDNPMPLLITHGWPGLVRRISRHHREARASGTLWRRRARRLHRGCTEPARLRLLRSTGCADRPARHRADLEHVDDGGARLRALRRAGRRLGRHHHLMACAGPSEESAGDPPEHARAAAVRRQGFAAAQRRGEGLDRARAGAAREDHRLSADPGHEAANARLWPDRFAGRSRRMDPGKIPRLDDSRTRTRRRRSISIGC